MRSFYSNVLYTKSAKQSALPPLLLDLNHLGSAGCAAGREFSFVFVNERFLKAVKLMEEVVLVPTRLLDVSLEDSGGSSSGGGGGGDMPALIAGPGRAGPAGAHSSLFEVFHLLKKFRDRMQSMAVTSEDEIVAGPGAQPGLDPESEALLALGHSHSSSNSNSGNGNGPSPKLDCDSGLWSSLSSSASRDSMEEDAASQEETSTPATGVVVGGSSSGSGQGSAAASVLLGSCVSDDRCTSSSHSSSDADSSSEVSCVSAASSFAVKSLLSAKSLCTFLTDMTAVAHFVIRKYLQETQSDLCL